MAEEYTPETLEWYRGFLEDIPGEKHVKSETDADTLCPGHDDTNPSLGVDLRTNGRGPQIELNCRSRGCDRDGILAALGKTWRDLYLLNGRATGSKTGWRNVEVPGCTLEEYAAFKNLPRKFLAGEEGHPIALQEANWGGKPAVAIPYTDQEGNEIMRRFRTGLRKTEPDTRMRSEKGVKITTPYGLNWLDVAHEEGYVLLVEGESDCHVAWYHRLPALGIP